MKLNTNQERKAGKQEGRCEEGKPEEGWKQKTQNQILEISPNISVRTIKIS